MSHVPANPESVTPAISTNNHNLAPTTEVGQDNTLINSHQPQQSSSTTPLPLPTMFTAANASRPAVLDSTTQPSASNQHMSNGVKNDSGDDSASGKRPSSYGTRSRNRTGRVNYADDDMDYEFMKPITATSKRSTPSESSSRQQAVDTVDAPPAASAKFITVTDGEFAAKTNGTRTDEKRPATKGDAPPEQKKKRKYERAGATTAKASSAGEPRQSANTSLPGTSQFFATADTPTAAPPSKKRRTGDHVGGGATQNASSAGVVSNHRKGSTNHMARSGANRPSCLVTFERSGAILQNGKLVADDGTSYGVDDNAYLICEPPGEPYYLCRIMEFRHSIPGDVSTPVVSMLVNWFYRPKDIAKYNADSRFVYASMQSDESPLTSLRGRCEIRHRGEIEKLEEYRTRRDTFWFTQLFDRYIKRPYEMVPVSAVVNVPENVKRVLDERWKFLAVEPARMRELTSKVKLCKRCNSYCAPNDSVDCGVCRETWHMSCVRPALTRKPTRGFAWSCGACSRAHEQRLEARHGSGVVTENGTEAEEEVVDEERAAGAVVPEVKPENMSSIQVEPEAQKEDAIAKLWPWRYLGIHCRVEDVLQFDDRAIYPRATSRLGAKHEAVVLPWPGQPVQYVPPLVIERKISKNKKEAKLTKEQLAAIEADKIERATRPKYIQDEPPGWTSRGEEVDDLGENETCTLIFAVPEESEASRTTSDGRRVRSKADVVDDYDKIVRQLAEQWGLARTVHPGTPGYKLPKPGVKPPVIVPTNFLDEALGLLYIYQFNINRALQALEEAHQPADLGEPQFDASELKRFEEAVAKHGSDLRIVKSKVKTRPYGEIVRFFYTWKKTERGQQVWGQSEGRSRIRKKAEISWPELADEEDDSAFDNDKAITKKRKFQCKHCLTKTSRQWRRAPAIQAGAVMLADPKASAKDKTNQLIVSLCERCAVLWRRYAMKYEEPEDIAKSLIQAGGRAWKRKNDEESLREMVMANEVAGVVCSPTVAQAAALIGITVTVTAESAGKRKKLKAGQDEDSMSMSPAPDNLVNKKEKQVPPPPPPRPPTPPIIPAEPKWRDLPCAICFQAQIEGDSLCECTSCKLTVHKRCYGISEQSSATKWVCDTCLNDKNNQASLEYKCVLCPCHDRPMALLEPLKVSHRKKTEREKEKERLERELCDQVFDKRVHDQEEKGRPVWPREPLKKTASNNWMHIVCSIWTPEIRFSEPLKLEEAEGTITALNNPVRQNAVCKICRTGHGACLSCFQCGVAFHATCAQEYGYIFGFDITPVKGSRKDQIQTVTLGEETGSMQAAIWCAEHTIKTVVHPINEKVKDSDLTALQAYVKYFKQADRSLTGTVRKAQQFSQQAVVPVVAPTPVNRRASVLKNAKTSSTTPAPADARHDSPLLDGPPPAVESQHECTTCDTKSSFLWHETKSANNGVMDDSTADVKPTWQCHKCHTRDKLGVKLTNVADETDTEPPEPVDFFALLAPPPPPPVEMIIPSPQANTTDPMTLKLWDSQIWLYHPDGHKHALNGRIFGKLSDHAGHTWMFFNSHANKTMGFDSNRHAFVNENGHAIYNAKTLMDGLGDMLLTGRDSAHWRMADKPPGLIEDNGPAQGLVTLPRMNSNPQLPPLPPMSRMNSGPPPPRYDPNIDPAFMVPDHHQARLPSLGLPPLPPMQMHQPMHSPLPSVEGRSTPHNSYPLPSSAHASGFTMQGATPYSNFAPSTQSAFQGGYGSPPVGNTPFTNGMGGQRAITPNNQQQQGGKGMGASSSPNVRNLMR